MDTSIQAEQAGQNRQNTIKNIWVANKQLLLLIMGDISICASGCKILL